MASDVDLVVLTDEAQAHLRSPDFIAATCPDGRLVRSEQWGPMNERRVRLPSGLYVECCQGTSRQLLCPDVGLSMCSPCHPLQRRRPRAWSGRHDVHALCALAGGIAAVLRSIPYH
ncbi:hypothetical protein KEM60_03067 [Austwickia sp. TVS 96-490-7B]|nr:hypothetical protein [Austwickia sp. TVS 96-490-7B]